MSKPVIIFGTGGLAKAALEIFESNKVVVYGFLDDDPGMQGKQIEEISVLGTTDDEQWLKLIGDKCDAFVAVDDNALKATIIKSLRENRKAMPVNAIHSKASIAGTAILHHGNYVDQLAVIAAQATLGNHCLIHSGAIINFESKVGDFVQVGAGAIINSGATIEDHVFIGSGALIVSGINVGEGARIGAGSVVISDIKKNTTVFGNPAKLMG